MEMTGTPGKANLRSEVILLSIPGIALPRDVKPSQIARPCSRVGYKEVVLLGTKRAEVGPPQSSVDRQILPELVIVLREESPDARPVVLPLRRRKSRKRIEA